MTNWQIPLIVAALVFLAFIVFKVRPRLLATSGGAAAQEALREARARVEAAKTDEERTLALCDAAEAALDSVGGTPNAIAYYLRAMRASPHSSEIVERAALGLSRRPRALESLLWRRLGSEPWSGEGRPAVKTALRHLAALYAGPLKSQPRAKALEHAAVALGD